MKPFDIQTFDPGPGITLIEASAGTGKTFSITRIVSKIIASGQSKIDEILVLTFTNAATAELKERIRKELQDSYRLAESAGDAKRCSNLAEAIDAFDNAAIHTIHGFCQRTLHEFSLECGLSVEFEVLKESRDFNLEVRNTVIRRIQRESENRPELIPFCSSIGFGKNFVENILNYRQVRAGIAELRSSDKIEHKDDFTQALESLKQAWSEEGEAIKACLLDEKDYPLKRTSYSLEFIQRSMRLFDRWVNENSMDADLFTTFQKYGVSELSKKLKNKKTLPSSRFFELCETFTDSTDTLLFDVLAMVEEEMDRQLETLNHKKQKLRYDDLLEGLLHALKENPALAGRLRERYRFGLIDEFQDTDPVQFEILSRIFVAPIEEAIDEFTRPLILIGDPKQAIYGFRGGDIFTYLKAKQLSKDQYFLTTNWRSVPEINDGMNALLSRENAPPFAFPWLGYEPILTAEKNKTKTLIRIEGKGAHTVNLSGVHFRELPKADFSNQYQVIRQLVRDVQELLKGDYRLVPPANEPEREVWLSDIAILVDKNTEGAAVRKQLAKVGIQATVSGGSSVVESDEAMDWYQILRAVLSPNQPQLLRGALSTAPFAFNSAEIKQLENDFHRWDEIRYAFGQAHDHWIHGRFTQAIALLKNEFEWIGNLGRNADPLRVLANHHHILELLLSAQVERSLQPGELLEWLTHKIRNPDVSNETELLRLERDTQSVNILTMHKSKGLQFPIVFVPFPPATGKPRDLEPPFLIHDVEGDASCVYSGNQISPEIQARREQEVLSERLRLSYVAITRAEYQCTIYLQEKRDKTALLEWNLLKGEDAARTTERKGAFLWSETKPIVDEATLDSAQETPSLPLQEPAEPPENPAGVVQWSFTGMIQHRSDYTEPGGDENALFPEIPSEGLVEQEVTDIHHFPKGTHAGLFFHALLQQVDFQTPTTWPALTEEMLHEYSFDAQKWAPVALDMLERLSATPFRLGRGAILLSDLAPAQLFRETEFTFPLRFNNSKYESARIIFEVWQRELGNPYRLPDVESVGPMIEGYMKGIIDAWFEAQGKIYLVDWKSNWLGEGEDAYSPTALVTAMNDHHYHLQYLLYTCALTKYLPLVRPGFDYERDFAGIYYVFLRGVAPESKMDGIFYAKAPPAVVEALNRCFQT